MLGYIKAYKPELRIKEYEMYKAVYCSLCRYLGKEYGFLLRFTLSYDFTFYSLLYMALADNTHTTERKMCVCNPLKKCTYCKDSEDVLDLPAAASVIMVYYKALDNVCDEKGVKKLLYRFLLSFLSRPHKKAAAKYPDVEKIVSHYVQEQAKAEKREDGNMDISAAPTSDALSKLFALCGKEDSDKRALSRLGFCVGRYIYLLDALCDLKEDVKKGRYNPLSSCEDAKVRAERNIYMCINEAINAFELINIKQYKNILGNIIYMGMEDTFKRSKANEKSI